MGQLEVDSPFQADARTFAGLVVAILVGAVATAAGVGGGAIYIPLFNVLIGFALKPSTALSQACITFGSLAAVMSNLPRTHPNVPEAPLIDFPLMLLLTPVLLVGVGIGVLLNVTLPSWLLTMLLLLLLLLLLSQAVAKGRALWAQESKRAQAAAEAAARHDNDGGEGGAGAADGVDGRAALLGPNDPHGAGQPAAAGSAAALAAAAAGLRNRRTASYSGPRGPRGLEADQDASFGCLEGLEGDASAIVSAAVVAGGAGGAGGGGGGAAAGSSFRRRAADVSWDCMEGVASATADGAASCETLSSSGPLPSSAFAAAAAAAGVGVGRGPPSSAGGEEEGWTGLESGAAAAAAAGAIRSGPGGASPTVLSPASSLAYAPSWRAFNELGALDFETDFEGASDADGGAAGGGPGRASASTSALPPTARLLSQLLRKPLPPGLQMSPSVTRSPGAPFRRQGPLGRRSSFDQSTAAAVVEEDEETGGGGRGGGGGGGAAADSWLARRSKWRSRFPPGALPHRSGGSRAALLPPNSFLSAMSSPALGPRQQQPPPYPSGASSRTSGSGAARPRSRSLRSRDDGGGGGGGGDGAGGGGGGGSRLDQPLLGRDAEDSERGDAAAVDPRVELGRPPLGPNAATAAATDGGGGGDAGRFGAADLYWPPSRLETLHEEVDDRVEERLRPTGRRSRTGASVAAAPPMASAFAAVSAFPAADAADAVASTPRTPALPASRAAEEWDRSGRAASTLQVRQEQQQLLYDSDTSGGGGGGRASAAASAAAAASPAEAFPSVFLEIEDGPAAGGGGGSRRRGGGWRRRAGRARRAVAAAASDWAESWRAAGRRIPRRFAAGLFMAWLVYLGLNTGRGFCRQCSAGWWTLFVLQIAAMLGVSVGALVMTAAALAKHAEATGAGDEAAAADGGGADGGDGSAREALAPAAPGENVAAAVAGMMAEAQREAKELAAARRGSAAAAAAAEALEPAMGGTAALLVLQAPLSTLCFTFFAGLTGGLLGLGGGMVMGPLLLHVGVQPQVTAASSGAMVLFSSSSALIQFALLSRLNFQYAAVFGAASLVAGAVGTHAVAGAIKRSGRPSIVVLALAAVMGVGTLFVGVFGLRDAVEQLRSGSLGFVSMCYHGAR